MKKVFHKIVSLAMAFVVLFSTMSFMVNMHYCGDTLVETAFFQKAKGCGVEMEKPSTKSCSITKKSCCDDKQLSVEGQDELQLTVDKIGMSPALKDFQTGAVITSIGIPKVSEKLTNAFTSEELDIASITH